VVKGGNVALPADKVILNSMLVTVASTVSASLAPSSLGGKGEFPHPRLLIGTGIAYIGLGILGDIAPGIASPLAVAMAVTALTYYGLPILDKMFTDKGAQK
jgi:hypothetical protein